LAFHAMKRSKAKNVCQCAEKRREERQSNSSRRTLGEICFCFFVSELLREGPYFQSLSTKSISCGMEAEN
jgi:hypothetical protein